MAPAAGSTCCSPHVESAPSGFAYGLDMTTEMLKLARAHAREAGADNVELDNVEFLRGHIEAIPLPDASVDVVTLLDLVAATSPGHNAAPAPTG